MNQSKVQLEEQSQTATQAVNRLRARVDELSKNGRKPPEAAAIRKQLTDALGRESWLVKQVNTVQPITFSQFGGALIKQLTAALQEERNPEVRSKRMTQIDTLRKIIDREALGAKPAAERLAVASRSSAGNAVTAKNAAAQARVLEGGAVAVIVDKVAKETVWRKNLETFSAEVRRQRAESEKAHEERDAVQVQVKKKRAWNLEAIERLLETIDTIIDATLVEAPMLAATLSKRGQSGAPLLALAVLAEVSYRESRSASEAQDFADLSNFATSQFVAFNAAALGVPTPSEGFGRSLPTPGSY